MGSADPTLEPLATLAPCISALAFSGCVSMGTSSDAKKCPLRAKFDVQLCLAMDITMTCPLLCQGVLGGSPHLAQCVLYHKNRENVKCRGSAGGNTPAEPTSLIYSTKVRHKLHQVGEAVSLSTSTFVDLNAKTHTKSLRDL